MTPSQEHAPVAVTWEDLVAQATLGTTRRPVPLSGTVAGVEVPDEPVEAQLLAASALLGIQRRVGATVLPAPPAVATAAIVTRADEAALPPPRASQILEVVLVGGVVRASESEGLVEDWLQRCAAGGYRVPDRLLPPLLNRLSGNAGAPTAAAISAIGEHGRWLASLNPDWAELAVPDWSGADVDVLVAAARGAARDRLGALRALRAAAPARAAEVMTELWAGLGAKERQALVTEVMADAPLASDEPFLEESLTVRPSKASWAAARALDRLPGSRRALRMAERLARLLQGGPWMPADSELPDASGPAPTGPQRASWWQEQIVIGAPLRTWVSLGHKPKKVVVRAAEDTLLIRALAVAATNQGEERWQRALLDLLLAPDAQNESTVLLAVLLESLPRPWPPALGRNVVKWALDRPRPGVALDQLIEALAHGVPPSMASDFETWAGYRGVDEFAVTKAMRRLQHLCTLSGDLPKAFERP